MKHSSRVRKISPLGLRVVLKIRSEQDVTDGGLYLPEGAKSSMSESLLAEVVEVATATESDHETNISGIPLGAVVLIGKQVGVKIPWDDRLRIVDTKDILAIVDEVHFS